MGDHVQTPNVGNLILLPRWTLCRGSHFLKCQARTDDDERSAMIKSLSRHNPTSSTVQIKVQTDFEVNLRWRTSLPKDGAFGEINPFQPSDPKVVTWVSARRLTAKSHDQSYEKKKGSIGHV